MESRSRNWKRAKREHYHHHSFADSTYQGLVSSGRDGNAHMTLLNSRSVIENATRCSRTMVAVEIKWCDSVIVTPMFVIPKSRSVSITLQISTKTTRLIGQST